MDSDEDDQQEIDPDVAAAMRLVAAMVLQALKDYHADIRRYGEAAARAMEPARYLHDDDPRTLGMLWCCNLLGLSPRHIHRHAHTDECRQALRHGFVVGYSGRKRNAAGQRAFWEKRRNAGAE